jgi:glycosyltransferase involved in cell wall biosynthesis
VEDLVPSTGSVAYHRLPPGATLGAKRNAAVELARGDLLAHWDDDDWYSPARIERQVMTMAASGAELVGTPRLDFYDPARRLAWRYGWPGHRRPWLAGTSLLYRRELWSRNRFADVATSEDTRFVWRTPARAVTATAEPDVVAIVHPGNTVPKAARGAYWRSVPVDEVEERLGKDLTFYAAMRLAPEGAER